MHTVIYMHNLSMYAFECVFNALLFSTALESKRLKTVLSENISVFLVTI